MHEIFLLIIVGLLHAVCADPSNQQAREFLSTANMLRQMHGSPRLKMNATLMQYAQDFANELASSDDLRNSGGPFGETVYWTASEVDTRHAVRDKWYAQGSSYDYNNEDYSPETGSFTQLIWKDTTDVGLGIATSASSGKSYMVASFWPQGNQEGQFSTNVQQPNSQLPSEDFVDNTTPRGSSPRRLSFAPRTTASPPKDNDQQEPQLTETPRTNPPQETTPITEVSPRTTPNNTPRANVPQSPQPRKPPVQQAAGNGDFGARHHNGANKADPDFLAKLSAASG